MNACALPLFHFLSLCLNRRSLQRQAIDLNPAICESSLLGTETLQLSTIANIYMLVDSVSVLPVLFVKSYMYMLFHHKNSTVYQIAVFPYLINIFVRVWTVIGDD